MHPKLTKLKSTIVPKGWGFEEILVSNDEYCGKILHFNKGAKFSAHAHKDKLETFWCKFGRLKVTGINTENAEQYSLFLGAGEILHVPRFCFHQIEALEESEIIEFSTKDSPTDSYRVFPGDSQKK